MIKLREDRPAMQGEHRALREMVLELADDLAAEIEGRYAGMKDHPAMKRRYDRDMESVVRARGLLANKRNSKQ